MLNVILATDKHGGIGINNELPWTFDIDKNYFYDKIVKTDKSSFPILIMGYKSYLDFSKVNLSSIIYYVIAKNSNILSAQNIYPNVYFFEYFEEAYKNCEYKDSDIWVLGGKKIYEEALFHPGCNCIYLTLIDGLFKCDVYVDLSKYNITWNNETIIQDINLKDNLIYDLYFKEGCIHRGNHRSSE